jgi:hypothetical protein
MAPLELNCILDRCLSIRRWNHCGVRDSLEIDGDTEFLCADLLSADNISNGEITMMEGSEDDKFDNVIIFYTANLVHFDSFEISHHPEERFSDTSNWDVRN